jgi:hypothetical protein
MTFYELIQNIFNLENTWYGLRVILCLLGIVFTLYIIVYIIIEIMVLIEQRRVSIKLSKSLENLTNDENFIELLRKNKSISVDFDEEFKPHIEKDNENERY